MKKLVLLGTFLALFFLIPDASAHRPEEGGEGITLIPDPTTSFAYYRELAGSEEVHIYQFEVQAGQFFHAGINIPQIGGLEGYGVSLALVGPGLPVFQVDRLPERDLGLEFHQDHADHGHSESGVIFVESRVGEDFYEPFTQTNYWGRQVLELDLPESGTYTLLVWNESGLPGKYVLDTGTKEVFGLSDLFRFPLWWFNTRAYFGQTPALIGIGLFAGFGLAAVIVRRKISGK